MYLKKIEAHGFKSFAEKTIIELNNGITGIVGPNGSGKSNVVDAVRWVLGEQSVKSLRGDGNMTDVIFSGSKSRSASNVASVTLIFDNSDSYFPISFNEVSIKRRVYKDGSNEYFLNGEKCRLKDITDILLDSGIAKESFNIISQGKIEEIISSKPKDRRIIFEEAAGVLKYKRRKEDAIRKLDRTHDNMNRVNDIINELESQVLPLKEQKEKALKYLDANEELQKIEVALITNDITNINSNYQEKKNLIEKINSEILNMGSNNSTVEAKVELLKGNIDKIDLQIRSKQQELMDKTTEVEKINSQKNIIIERKKYEVEDSKLHNRVLDLKERSYEYQNEIDSLNNKIELEKNKLSNIINIHKSIEQEIIDFKNVKSISESKLTNLVRNETSISNKIESLQDSIDNDNLLPYSVRCVLNNPKLNGIHNALGNLIEINEEYSKAIATSLGSSSSNIVVDNELVAKESINYLKFNKLGRATFFPLNVIKPKGIDPETLKFIKNSIVGIASELVCYDAKYHNIIQNQLGNVIVVNDIDTANIISKKIGYRYRVVTLDGEIIHVGGSITGGGDTKVKNIILQKHELEENISNLKKLQSEISKLEDDINEIDSSLKNSENKLYLITKEKVISEEEINSYKNSIFSVKEKLENVNLEINGTNHALNNTLSDEEESIMKKYYEELHNKESLISVLKSLQANKNSLTDEKEELELTLRKDNNLYNSKNKELNYLEIEVNRMDVKLDTLLNTLNETYNMTYEKALSIYHLEMEDDVARNKVQTLKHTIKELGVVNLAAPEEYDRVSVRYEFLIKQRDDLVNAENTLLDIIKDMDSVMEKEFIDTFNIVNKHFTETFKELFNGGTAELKLTDSENILETGIEIVASPPGKKLTSISLLSGGEKTFTAISVLFAILKSRPVPFCILDEVEAALDEVNVDSFGKYLINLNSKTQFILITHKKRTMEYANVLYGITMQESGVSKLVSVKLEDIKK